MSHGDLSSSERSVLAAIARSVDGVRYANFRREVSIRLKHDQYPSTIIKDQITVKGTVFVESTASGASIDGSIARAVRAHLSMTRELSPNDIKVLLSHIIE